MAGRRTRAKKNGAGEGVAATNDQVGTEAAPPANDAAAALAAGAAKKAGRGKRGHNKPPKVRPTMANLSDEQIAGRWLEFQGHKAAVDAANDRLKAFKKLIKLQGIDPADFEWAHKAKQRDPGAIDSETRRRNRIAVVTKLPIGTQLGLLDGQPTVDGNAQMSVATAIEDRKLATGSPTMEQTEHEAEIGGRKGVDIGYQISDNPYPKGHDNHEPWRRGFLKRVEERGEPAPVEEPAGDVVEEGADSSDFPTALAMAETAGRAAREADADIRTNPHPKDDARFNAWNKGFRARAAEIAGAATPQGAGTEATPAVTH